MYIENLPRLLSDAEYPIPFAMEVAYAALVVRRLLGRGNSDKVENRVLDRLWHEDETAYIKTIFIDPDQDAPPINHERFDMVVAYVLAHLDGEGFLEYLTPDYVLKRTDHPGTIANHLGEANTFVMPSHVRRAHAILIERGSRERHSYRRQKGAA